MRKKIIYFNEINNKPIKLLIEIFSILFCIIAIVLVSLILIPVIGIISGIVLAALIIALVGAIILVTTAALYKMNKNRKD